MSNFSTKKSPDPGISKNGRGFATSERPGRKAAFRKDAAFLCAPSMGAILEVEVLSQADHSERSEAQLREGDRPWEGSVERNCEPMDKNRIEGDADQGERA